MSVSKRVDKAYAYIVKTLIRLCERSLERGRPLSVAELKMCGLAEKYRCSAPDLHRYHKGRCVWCGKKLKNQ